MVILERGYLKLEGLLSKTGSYGRETLVIGKREFEDETEAVGNPSEETIYFDKDLSWELEVSRFVDCILNNKKIPAASRGVFWTLLRKAWQNQTQFSPQGAGY